MSIERMQSIALLAPASSRDRFIDWLYDQREVHLEEFRETPDTWCERFCSLEGDPSGIELRISRLQGAVDFLREAHKRPADFVEGLFPVKMLATRGELDEAVGAVDADVLSVECQRLQDAIEGAHEKWERLQSERDRLRELDFLKVRIGALRALSHVSIHLVSAVGQGQKDFAGDSRLGDDIFVESVSGFGNGVTYVMAAPKAADDRVQEVINDYGLREIALPMVEGTIAEELARVDAALEEARLQEKAVREEAKELSKQWVSKAELALAWEESERTRILQQTFIVSSPHVFAVHGYIRANRLEDFRARMEREFPGAELELVTPEPGTEPPVSVAWGNFLRPAGLLVKMFGLPSYRGIDPTSFLSFTFLLFFGICFGDVLYGVMLIGLAAWLKKRFRGQRGLVEFFRLFTYCGVSTVIFGVLMGSWAADLSKYFGEGNPVDALRMKLTLLDPLAKPVVALGIAVGIGVLNQFYGIFMRFLRDARRGDVASSVYDGVFWLTYLSSLLVLSIGLVLSAPKPLLFVSGGLFLFSAIGLVLTQGREEKSWPARLFTGLISLYGIMGTYGTTSFLGDVISYSRLMALGLTTSVVGMSFNIIAGMVQGIPYVGWFFFILVVVGGHVFNFSMSIMSAFVHSARLILLEWFGRFYEGNGVPFRPFGFQSVRLDIMEQR